jgi:hypothetical protein
MNVINARTVCTPDSLRIKDVDLFIWSQVTWKMNSYFPTVLFAILWCCWIRNFDLLNRRISHGKIIILRLLSILSSSISISWRRKIVIYSLIEENVAKQCFCHDKYIHHSNVTLKIYIELILCENST